jgi:hypothetical protein
MRAGSATFALNYGLALKRAGDLEHAERELLRSINLDPVLSENSIALKTWGPVGRRQIDVMPTLRSVFSDVTSC